MDLVFAGTPVFAATAMHALLRENHNLRLVLTQPDRAAGRGLRPTVSPVKQLALAHGLNILQPISLKDPAVQREVLAIAVDAWVVAAYGLILPSAILQGPRLGCLNIHASLLPRWRGAAPIQRALLAGDARSGITIMLMDEGLDTGPILLQEAIAIGPEETAGCLHDRLAELGAGLICKALQGLEKQELTPRPQPALGATYAAKLSRADTIVDWSHTATAIDRQIRALNPTPGAVTTYEGQPLKLWVATAIGASDSAPPGTVLQSGPTGILVACGEGALRLREVQRAGGRRMTAHAFALGAGLSPGGRLGG